MRTDDTAIEEATRRRESAAAEQAMLEHMHHAGLELISNRKRQRIKEKLCAVTF